MTILLLYIQININCLEYLRYNKNQGKAAGFSHYKCIYYASTIHNINIMCKIKKYFTRSEMIHPSGGGGSFTVAGLFLKNTSLHCGVSISFSLNYFEEILKIKLSLIIYIHAYNIVLYI